MVLLSAEIWLGHSSSVSAAVGVVALAELAAAVAPSVSPKFDPDSALPVVAAASVVVFVLACVSLFPEFCVS